MAIKPDASLASCVEFQIGVAVPAPLSGRLDTLVELANSAAANTSRKEVLAALLLAASPDPDVLAEVVRVYRTARAADAIVEGSPPERFLRAEPSPPGPRPRRSE